MTIDESQEDKEFLNTKTRSELESDLEQCLERKKNLEEAKSTLHNLKIDLETMLKDKDMKISELESRLSVVQSEKEALEGKMVATEESRTQDQTTLEELRGQINQVGQEKTHLENENFNLKKKIEVLEHDKETYRAYSDEAEKILEVKTEKLLADLRYIQEENQHNRIVIAEKEEIIRNYEQKIRELTEKENAFLQQMTDRKDLRSVSKEFMDNLESKLVDLQNLMNSFGSQLESPGISPSTIADLQEGVKEGGEPEETLKEEVEEEAGEFRGDEEEISPDEIQFSEPRIQMGEEEEIEVKEEKEELEDEEEKEEFFLSNEEESKPPAPSERLFDLANSFETEDIFESDLDLELPESEDLSSLEEPISFEEFEEKNRGYEAEEEPGSNKNVEAGERLQDKKPLDEDKDVDKEKFPWEEEDNSPSWGF